MNPITYEELDVVRNIAMLVDSNPFAAERQRLAKRVLGNAFAAPAPGHAAGTAEGGAPVDANEEPLRQLAERLAAKLRKHLGRQIRVAPSLPTATQSAESELRPWELSSARVIGPRAPTAEGRRKPKTRWVGLR